MMAVFFSNEQFKTSKKIRVIDQILSIKWNSRDKQTKIKEELLFYLCIYGGVCLVSIKLKKGIIETRHRETMESKKNKLQKKNGKWKKTEHSRFLRALQKYGKNWIQVQEYVKTRTLEQVRSHAQKMFISMSEEQKKQFQKQQLRREKQLCQVRNWKLDGKNLEKNSEVSVILPIQTNDVCQKEQNGPMLKMEDEKNQSQSTVSVCDFIKPAPLQFHSPNQYSYFFTTLISNYQKFGNQEEFFNNFSFLPVSANPPSNSKQGIF